MRSQRLPTWLVLPILAAAGCDGRPGGSATAPAPDAVLEFRGQRPCADCLGIESWLRLEQRGQRRDFRLVDVYASGRGDQTFEERGQWEARGDLLRLRATTGGERTYVRIAQDHLMAVGSDGQPIPGAMPDVMVPVTATTER